MADWNISPLAGEIDLDNLQSCNASDGNGPLPDYSEITREEEKKMVDCGKKSSADTEIVHKFPMTMRASTHMAVIGAKIIRAELEVYGIPIAKYTPVYASDWTKDDSVKLDFFGDVPFHAQFVSPGSAIVSLYCTDDLPSLQFCIDEYSDPQWIHCGENQKYFMEKVVPSPLDTEYYLFYGNNVCGLKPVV